MDRFAITRHRNKGFALRAVLIVLGVLLGLLMVALLAVIMMWRSVYPHSIQSDAASDAANLDANIRSSVGQLSKYADLNNASARQLNLVPDHMIDPTSSSGITSAWGSVHLFGLPGDPSTRTPPRFAIRYEDVRSDACARVVMVLSGFFDDIRVVNSDGQSLGTSLFTRGKGDRAKVAEHCASTRPLSLDFIAH